MKYLFCFICLLSSKLFAQNLNVYNYGNYDGVGLVLINNTYSIESRNPMCKCDDHLDCLPSKEEELPSVIWSQGTFTCRKDTVICVDSKLHKECWLIREKGQDVLRLIKLKGFDYKNDVLNKQSALRNKKVECAEISNLLKSAPVFYIIYYEVLDKDGRRKMTELSSWEKGVKIRVYRNDY